MTDGPSSVSRDPGPTTISGRGTWRLPNSRSTTAILGASDERVRRGLCALAAEWGNLLHFQRRRRMGVVRGSERDQPDRALLSLNVFGRTPVEHFSAFDERLEYLHILQFAWRWKQEPESGWLGGKPETVCRICGCRQCGSYPDGLLRSLRRHPGN